MKNCTLNDLQELKDKGGAFLNIINGDEFTWISANKTMIRLNEYIDALIARLTNDGARQSETADTIKNIQRPFDIWLLEWEKDVEVNKIFGGTKIVKEKRISYYFVFHKTPTKEEVVYWNMWIMGYFTRTYR